ncbi:MAG TPA: LLM class flavin-dependent oxidoreductase [Flavobacterium sp.]
MANKTKKQLRLNAFLLGTGQHMAAWRDAQSLEGGNFSPEHFKDLALIAERGKFDAIFLGDVVGFAENTPLVRSQSPSTLSLDPLTLLSYISAFTKHIGLISTVSTSYLEPYHLARKFATLDIISNGRAAWNLVTSGTDFEARNFGLDEQRKHADRYKRATEYVQVVKGLWDSFEDDAFEYDKANAQYYQPEKLHELNHRGEYYTVKGPLNVKRPVQGHPVVVQAGSSDDGQELAAATADVVFTAQNNLDDAIAFYSGLKSRLLKYGRSEDELLILPGLNFVIGETEADAKRKFDAIQELIPDASGKAFLAIYGIDVSNYNSDEPFPELPFTEGVKSRQQLIADLAKRENLSIRQVYQRFAGSRGHLVMHGTLVSIADQIEEWLDKGAADGFNLMPPLLPSSLEEFVDLVVPELQKRGIFRTEYEGKSLRENLGLKRPVNQYSVKTVES